MQLVAARKAEQQLLWDMLMLEAAKHAEAHAHAALVSHLLERHADDPSFQLDLQVIAPLQHELQPSHLNRDISHTCHMMFMSGLCQRQACLMLQGMKAYKCLQGFRTITAQLFSIC